MRASWRPSGREWAVFGLTALVVIGAGAWWGRQPSQALLDAERHRPALRAVEAVLYVPRPVRLTDPPLLAERLQKLRVALGGDRAAGRAATVVAELDTLARGAAQSLEAGSFDLVDLRGRWERLRDEHFRSATWFMSGRPFLDEAQRWDLGPTPPPDQPARTEEAERVLAAFEMLLEQTRLQLPQDGSGREEWRGFADRLEAGLTRMTIPDGEYQSAERAAYRKLQDARKRLLTTVAYARRETHWPDRRVCEQDLDGVAFMLKAAREKLASGRGDW